VRKLLILGRLRGARHVSGRRKGLILNRLLTIFDVT